MLLPSFEGIFTFERIMKVYTFIIRTNEVILNNKVIITYVHNTYEQINNNISK